MLYIFNQSEALIDILSNESIDDPIISNDNFKRQVNGEWSYTFDVNITKLVEQNIKVKNKVGFYDENNNFQLFTIEKIEDNFGDKDIKSVLCYHDFYSLVNKIVENLELHNATASTVLTQILQGTNYQIGNVMELGNRDFFITYESTLQALNSLLNAFGGEVGYRLTLNANKTGIGQRFVDIGRQGSDTGIRFSFDLNITGIKRTVETTNLFNVLYGRGKASDTEDEMGNRKITFADVTWTTPTNPTNKPLGQTYIEDAESIGKWGRLEGVFQSDDTEDKEILLQRTFEKLQEMKSPMITYEVSIVDLAKITGFEHLKVQLGDTIFIYDTDYDINLEARIIEESYSIFDPTAKEIVLGNFLKGYTDNNATENLSSRIDILEDDIKNGVAVGYPDTLPTVPTVTANGLFSTVQLEWTYESKVHYEYEVYASKVLNFTPDNSNLIYRGKASAYLHEVLPKETWHYRVRAINTHGNYTDYSTQVTATTLKIADATQYFEDVAISHALIKDLDMDKATVGHLKGTRMDLKEVSVTDGNGNKTFEVDSFGNVIITEGVTTINKDGIIVRNENSDTYTQIDNDSFTVNNNNGGTIADFGRNSLIPNLVSGTIEANSIFANNVASKSAMSNSASFVKTYYVNGATGNDSNDGLSSATAFRTVQYVIDNYIPEVINEHTQIKINGSVQSWHFAGRSGRGIVEFRLEDDCIVGGGLTLEGCTNTVRVFGNSATTKGTCNNGINISNCNHFDIGWVTFRGANWSTDPSNNIYIHDGSRGYIRFCDFNSASYCIVAQANVDVWLVSNKGSNVSNYVGIGAYTRIWCKTSGTDTCPDYTGLDFVNFNNTHSELYNIFRGCTFTKTASAGWTPAYTPTQKTNTWNFNKIWSDETLNGWSDRNELIQGYSSAYNTGRWTGYIQTSDNMGAIRNAISGATNLSGRLYVQRRTSSGASVGTVCAYGSDGTALPTVSCSQGSGVWITLNSTIISKIQSGAITYFYLKNDNNSITTYMKMETLAKIEITYTN